MPRKCWGWWLRICMSPRNHYKHDWIEEPQIQLYKMYDFTGNVLWVFNENSWYAILGKSWGSCQENDLGA